MYKRGGKMKQENEILLQETLIRMLERINILETELIEIKNNWELNKI